MRSVVQLYIVAGCLLLCTSCLYAQDEQLPDLDSLKPEDFEFESDLLFYHSTGWFPRPFPGYSLAAGIQGIDIWDRAHSIRSSAFAPTTFPFSHSDPYGDSDEREILKPFSDDEEDDSYPVTGLNAYMGAFTLNLPLPLVLRAEAGLLIGRGLLFSSDKTRSFLAADGSRRSFHEVTVYYLEDYMLKGSVGLQIPVYGAFLSTEEGKIASYYYLFGDYTALYSVDRQATQYAQIADAKDQLRYFRGSDTTLLRSTSDIPAFNKFRPAATVGIGWSFTGMFATFAFEMYISIPMTSVLKDAVWKQYMQGARFTLGYQW